MLELQADAFIRCPYVWEQIVALAEALLQGSTLDQKTVEGVPAPGIAYRPLACRSHLSIDP